MGDLLAEAEAELYTADPDGFTALRTELAERARDAGEPAVAKKITALRKPTRSAWVVNRLVRRAVKPSGSAVYSSASASASRSPTLAG